MSRQQLVTALNENLPQFAKYVADHITDAQLESYAGIPHEQLVHMAMLALQAFMRDLEEEQEHYFADHWEKVAENRAEQNARVADLLLAVFDSEYILDAFVAERFASDMELRLWWVNRVRKIVYAGVVTLSRIFTIVRERIIRNQETQIRALSTPIIPLYTGILALPLVGAIDSYRAGQILEALLTGISEQQAEVVIMDITGVPVVDTGVAHYLLQATRAARLLGTRMVLVGISAEVAQTIVQSGADLSDITTRANLQSGIEYALDLQGLAIRPK
jgi:rsbT co-antagonist protein RsbR